MKWEEVKDIKTLAKIKSVEEMVPTPLKASNAAFIWEEQYRILEMCLQVDCTIEEACNYAWISVPSYYKHREKNPEFARRMDLAKQLPMMNARAAVMRRILQGDAKMALEFLNRRDRRYKPDAADELELAKKTNVTFNIVETKWADWVTSTELKSASDWYANSSEPEKLTPRENEDQVLENMDSLISNNE